MGVAENIKVVNGLLDAFNARDWDWMMSLFTESAISYLSVLPEPLKGPAAQRDYLKGIVLAFPDMRVAVRRAFGQGDWVAQEALVTGTHLGVLHGPMGPVPPTRGHVRLEECVTYRLQDGKIAEVHQYFDMLEQMVQLGLIPRESRRGLEPS